MLFRKLNNKLKQQGVKKDLYVVGGCVMCCKYNSRTSTKDIDAIFDKDFFEPIIKEFTQTYKLQSDWLNNECRISVKPLKEDAVVYKNFSNLRVYFASTRYMLAMKTFSCRARKGYKDIRDLKFLIKKMKLTSSKDVLDIAFKYFNIGMFNEVTFRILKDIFKEDEQYNPYGK